MKSFLSKRSMLALAALLIGVLLVVYFVPLSQHTPNREALKEVQSIETLRVQFNRDAGKTRLILLMVPT